MRRRDPELNSYWGTICTPVGMTAADGKNRKIQTANTQGLLRIIQSVSSSKVEPFKRWLAKVGYERLEEIENPERAKYHTISDATEQLGSVENIRAAFIKIFKNTYMK